MPEEIKTDNDVSDEKDESYDKAKIVSLPEEPKKDEEPKRLSESQMIDYIDKLKDENAKRRIKSNKLEQELEKYRKIVESEKQEKDTVLGKLSEYEQKKKEAEEAEKSESERLKSRMSEMVDKFEAINNEYKRTQQLLKEKDLLIDNQSRERLIDKLIKQNDFDFSSEYERTGFLSETLSRNADNEFNLNDEELVLKIKDFVKERKVPPKTPQGGPVNKFKEMPVLDEVKDLLNKRDLSIVEQKRLDELLSLIG